MFDVSYEHALPDPGPRRRGFTQTLREMSRGGSVDLPLSKKAGVYSAARAAGVKVRIESLDKGLVRVWRADGPVRPSPAHVARAVDDGLDIFGQPVSRSSAHIAQAAASATATATATAKKTVFE
jgi:hypothetical protein